MIRVNDLSICYRMPRDRATSVKEYALRRLRGPVRYEEFWALRDVSFTARRGEVLGVVGPNGAGKSTLLRTVAGILRPTSGTVALEGTVAPMLELGSGFDYELTGRENIYLNGAFLGYSKAFLDEKYDRIVDFSGLGQFIGAPLRSYSSGMVMRLAFSVAAAVRPDVLIVDEILSVGDGEFQARSAERMRELMRGGAAVLFVSHSLDQVAELCDRALWLEGGRVRELGDARSVCGAYRAGGGS
ncbi:MAG: ABC transporter ATP-binding protein [Oscillospiraceae bacterium]|nr:ABC transporter ATP-binding protein [Oscillospiraceae bacterium]